MFRSMVKSTASSAVVLGTMLVGLAWFSEEARSRLNRTLAGAWASLTQKVIAHELRSYGESVRWMESELAAAAQSTVRLEQKLADIQKDRSATSSSLDQARRTLREIQRILQSDPGSEVEIGGSYYARSTILADARKFLREAARLEARVAELDSAREEVERDLRQVRDKAAGAERQVKSTKLDLSVREARHEGNAAVRGLETLVGTPAVERDTLNMLSPRRETNRSEAGEPTTEEELAFYMASRN